MKRLVLLLVVIVVGFFLYSHWKKSSTSGGLLDLVELKEQPWPLFQPDHHRFEVRFPMTPNKLTDLVLDSRTRNKRYYEIYLAEDPERTAYLVTSITFPEEKDFSKADRFYQEYIQEMLASNPNNELIQQQPAQFLGRDGLDFDVTNGAMTTANRIFLDGEILYLLSTVSSGQPLERQRAKLDHFASSFKLTPSASVADTVPPKAGQSPP